MSKDSKKPAIRFKGFTDDWEQRKLGEALASIKDGTHGTHKDVTNGPLLLSAKNIKDGKVLWDNSDRRISETDFNKIHSNYSLESGDVLLTIVGSIGETAIYKQQPEEITFQRSVAFLRPKKEILSNFLYSEIQTSYFQKELDLRKSISAQPGIYLGELSEIPFSYPQKISEQQKIGEFFFKLDNLITLHQRKLDKLKNIKKALLEKMFPRNGENIPEVRFKGFSDDWEQRKFSELYAKVTEKNDLSFGADKIISVANMYFKEDTKESSDDYMKTYNVMRLGDIAFEGNRNKNYAHGRFVENTIGDGIVSHVFDVFRPIVDYDLNYWKYYINNEIVMGRTMARCTKSSTMMTNLVANDFLKEAVLVPVLEEQKKIGQYFSNLDNLITLHQRKLDKLKNIKKALLEKMFV